MNCSHEVVCVLGRRSCAPVPTAHEQLAASPNARADASDKDDNQILGQTLIRMTDTRVISVVQPLAVKTEA
jgi:hypothetical protein